MINLTLYKIKILNYNEICLFTVVFPLGLTFPDTVTDPEPLGHGPLFFKSSALASLFTSSWVKTLLGLLPSLRDGIPVGVPVAPVL
jgi:hypothetical protein